MTLLLVVKIAYQPKPLTTFTFLRKVKSLANDPIVFFVVYSNSKLLDMIFGEVSVALCINLCLDKFVYYPTYPYILLSYHINIQVLDRYRLDIKFML